jgi:mono/diheme cytochrome c family protein
MRTPLSATLRRLVAGAGVLVVAITFGSRAEAQELRDQYHQAPRDTVSQEVYDGWKQFNLNCARCHGEDVLGSTIAPHLIVSLKPEGPINTKEAFLQVVCAGRPAKGMPAWCSLGMDPGTIEKIYAYVKARSDGKMSPGRPARKAEG